MSGPEHIGDALARALEKIEVRSIGISSMSDEFDWNGDDVVFPSTMAIAVYTNPSGDIVIRSQADYPHEDVDPVIVVPRKLVDDFIAAIKNAMGR